MANADKADGISYFLVVKAPNSNSTKRKTYYLNAKDKTMILLLFNNLKQIHPHISVDEVIDKVAYLSNVSRSTVYRAIQEYKSAKQFSSKKIKFRSRIQDLLDDYMKNAIRKKVHEFYFKKDIPTIDTILKAVNEDNSLPNFKRSTFYNFLKSLNFNYAKNKLILDTNEVIVWRREYLKQINVYRSENRTIYYLDEIWVNEGYSNTHISIPVFMSGILRGFKKLAGRGTTHIICHIGSDEGFVPDALWAFETQLSECHKETVAQSFEEWFKEILPNLEDRAVIVVDNAPCHTRRIENIPSYTSTKSEIQSWLSSKNIHFESDSLKVELLDIVNKNKEPYNKYVIDELAREDNKIVMRIPPYHDELNPFSLIWEEVKNYVTSKTSTFEVPDVLNLLHEAVSRIGKESWENSIKHVREKVEKEMWDLDNILESFIEPLIIKLKNENEYDSCSE